MPRPLGVFQSMAQIFAWEFDNFLESQEAPIALSVHSRLPPPAHLCAIKERTPRQTRKVQVHLVGKGHFPRNCLGLVPSQWAMSLSMGTLGGAAWGSDSPNKAVFNWPGREWQERRWGEAPSWTGRTGLGIATPPTQERVLGAQPGLCTPNLWHSEVAGRKPPQETAGSP